MTEPTEKNIELISGNNSILLIAPHGVETEPYDDISTAALIRPISEQLNCSAIINTTYRKPTENQQEKRNNRKPNPEKKILDLNIVKQAQKHPEFISKIKEIVDTEPLTYVFWIHGIDDDNIEKDVHCLIGYGQPKEGEEHHYTAKKENIDKILNQFEENGIKAVVAPETSNYRGWEETNMNQWFRLNQYTQDKVQSIQLEFKMTGCRDNADNLKATATNIAKALSFLTNSVSILPSKDMEKEDTAVEEVYQKLKRTFRKHFQKAMLEAGQHIIKSFYDNDYKRAQEKESTGKKSLAKLIKMLQNDSKGDAPSRTWVYDAVNIAIDHHLFEEKKLPSVYGQMGHSHKVNLTYAPNLEVKKALIKETVENKYTVAKLKERIREEKKGTGTEYISLKKTLLTSKLEEFDTKKLNSPKEQTLKLKKKAKDSLNIYQKNLKKIEDALSNASKPANR